MILPTSTALIYDGTMILAEALKQIGFDHLKIEYDRGIKCFDAKSIWSKGYTITNFMRSVSWIFSDNMIECNGHGLFFVRSQSNYTGLTGLVEFDTQGLRSNVEIDVLKLDSKGLTQIGSFKPTNTEILTFLPIIEEQIDTDDLPLSATKFNVIISEVSQIFTPFLRLEMNALDFFSLAKNI